MLVPSSDKPIDLVFPQETNVKKIYGALAAAAGINIIYDPQLSLHRHGKQQAKPESDTRNHCSGNALP
jgi:hypothetical protein